MKNKKLIIGLVIAVVILGIIFIKNPNTLKGPAKKAALPVKAEQAKAKAAVKKTFSKEMGGLTVKIADINKKDMYLGLSAYRSTDRRSSVHAATFSSNRMQELLPGDYDIQIQTIPPMLYKGITVSKDKETIEELGALTGAVNVKLFNSKKKDAYIPVKILAQKSGMTVASGATNRPIQVLSGMYDVEIGVMPRQLKKDMKVEAGKVALVDLGYSMGAVIIKAADENNKEVRLSARIKKADTGEVAASIVTNRPVEILKGTYIVELLSAPVQTKKDVVIEAGSEAIVEFIVQAPLAPAKVQAPATQNSAVPLQGKK
ncbi:MAG: hypothetical protein Q8Q87_01580 [Candidatus Omnitrophota bacterium]|nr:hypothetical protein [Candidatus Omnitrophota bacterium]